MEHVKISMTPKASLSICHVTQNDNGREVSIDFEDYTLTGAEDVSLIIRKPDGTRVETALENTASNFVIWSSVPSECDTVGLANCEIKAEDDGVVLYSASFNMNIEADPYGSDVTTASATGNPCTFTTDLADALVSLTADIVCGGGNGSPDSPIPIVGHSELNIGNTQIEEIRELFTIDPSFRGRVNFNQLVYEPTIWTQNYKGFKAGTSFVQGHKILMSVGGTATSDFRAFVFSNIEGSINNSMNIGIGTTIFNCPFTQTQTVDEGHDANNTVWIFIANYENWSGRYINIIDLTQMFGSTIADYIYNLEQSQAGAGVEFFKAIYPQDYYPYNAGQDKIVGDIIPVTVAFGQTVYGGVYDKSGRLTITHGYVALDSLTWDYSGGSIYLASIPDCALVPNQESIANWLCSCFPIIAQSEHQAGVSGISGSNWFNGLTFWNEEGYTQATFEAAIVGQSCVYELATPIVIDVPSISVFAENGTNNVFSDCLGDVSATYIKKV